MFIIEITFVELTVNEQPDDVIIYLRTKRLQCKDASFLHFTAMEPSTVNTIFQALNIDSGAENYIHQLCREDNVANLKSVVSNISNYEKYRLLSYDSQGQQCIHLAASCKYFALWKVDILIQAGVNINTRELQAGNTALHIAVYNKNYELVEFLCRQQMIRLDLLNSSMLTPYLVAHAMEDEYMIELLQCYGADD
uniref:Ankyrinrepeats-containing protein n=1 Tax=Toxoneuron nigriceps polydnavirus TaxID=191766 RepID=Q5GR53_9VIRU|nr:ankyrinrepeats-containing protein [Toxoneuron nigriceps polydnavirus]